MAEFDNNDQQGDIFAKAVRAGKRTYFFDVRSTRSNDYYLTITESKKRFTEGSDRPFFEKHKIFLYKEDFHKFIEALNNTVNHVKQELMPDVDFSQFDQPHEKEEAAAETPANGKGTEHDSELKWD